MSRCCNALYPILSLLIFGGTLFFNYAAATGLFSNLDVGQVSDIYNLEITPASWTFSIWAVIYTWQFLWLLYTLVVSCKYDMDSPLFGALFWVAYNLANILNAVWIVVWVNEKIWPAAVILIAATLCLIVTAYIAHKYMYVNVERRNVVVNGYGGVRDDDRAPNPAAWLDNASKWNVSLLYGLVLNGVPFYGTWTVVASNLNFGIALCYKAGMENQAASLLMLSILTCVILFYWFLDFYRLKVALKRTYSPYIVLVVAFCGILTNDNTSNATYAFTLTLLIVAVLAFVAKIIMTLQMKKESIQTQQLSNV